MSRCLRCHHAERVHVGGLGCTGCRPSASCLFFAAKAPAALRLTTRALAAVIEALQ